MGQSTARSKSSLENREFGSSVPARARRFYEAGLRPSRLTIGMKPAFSQAQKVLKQRCGFAVSRSELQLTRGQESRTRPMLAGT
eukprot:scaffold18269_cov71-Phaeocystis_antarctica.AAC.15